MVPLSSAVQGGLEPRPTPAHTAHQQRLRWAGTGRVSEAPWAPGGASWQPVSSSQGTAAAHHPLAGPGSAEQLRPQGEALRGPCLSLPPSSLGWQRGGGWLGVLLGGCRLLI